jgi:iron complex transport system substrate-binding protein
MSELWRLLALLLILSLQSAAAAAAAVVDDSGARVALPEPARRIVSLAPHATELLFAAGAGARVVGVVSHSDYPTAARALPQVGGYERLDLEAILGLAPDLVVAWESGNPGAEVERLRALGIPVYVTELRRLEDIPATLERIGILAGTPGEADAAAAAFRDGVEALRRRYAGRSPVRVFYQIWDSPLMTVGGDHLISSVIELCGGRNVFADQAALAPAVDVESVLVRDPEAIVASGMAAERPEWLDGWRRWPGLGAVRSDALFLIHPDLIQRPTPRILEGAEQLCADLDRVRSRRGE